MSLVFFQNCSTKECIRLVSLCVFDFFFFKIICYPVVKYIFIKKINFYVEMRSL